MGNRMSPGSGREEEEAEKEGEKKELPFVLDEYNERVELFLDDLPEGTTKCEPHVPEAHDAVELLARICYQD